MLKKSLNATTSSAVPRTDTGDESDDDIHLNVAMESLEMRMYRLLVSNNLEIVFPNTETAFRSYLSLMIWNSYSERSFSKMKLIKSQLRACMKQERLNNLTLLSIENKKLTCHRLLTILLFKNRGNITCTKHPQNRTRMTIFTCTYADIVQMFYFTMLIIYFCLVVLIVVIINFIKCQFNYFNNI